MHESGEHPMLIGYSDFAISIECLYWDEDTTKPFVTFWGERQI